MNTLEKYYFWCQKILPTVYDNSLSYYEVLCQLTKHLNDVIDYLNNEDTSLKDYVDTQIASLKQYVDTQDTHYYNLLTSMLNDGLDGVRKDFIDFQNKVNQEIATFELAVHEELRISSIVWDLKFNKLKEDIEDLLKKYSVLCFNPTNGKTEMICKVINDVYENVRYEAFTCLEFDSSGITCSEFDDSEITASQFDISGKRVLGYMRCKCKLRNPITGLVESIQNVINSIVSQFNNGITATAYDALSLTANAYDNKSLSAYDYDFDGKNLLP